MHARDPSKNQVSFPLLDLYALLDDDGGYTGQSFVKRTDIQHIRIILIPSVLLTIGPNLLFFLKKNIYIDIKQITMQNVLYQN